MFYLKRSSSLFLRICDVKRFQSNEYHITRIYNYSVLIVMMEGILQFYEDGILHTLYPGDYYIQRAGLLQEGMNIRAPIPCRRSSRLSTFIWSFAGRNIRRRLAGFPFRGAFPRSSCFL